MPVMRSGLALTGASVGTPEPISAAGVTPLRLGSCTAHPDKVAAEAIAARVAPWRRKWRRSCFMGSATGARHHGQGDRGGLAGIVVHRIVGDHALGLVVVVATGVEVAVEAREIAARYLHAQLVPGAEVVAGVDRLEGHLGHLA